LWWCRREWAFLVDNDEDDDVRYGFKELTKVIRNTARWNQRIEFSGTGTASIFAAATFGEKIVNAAKYAAAGAREAASKTELAMIERQILGFKEEFGVEMYPIFESMEDNEGWLPTDRKVRSLYDSAREDIAKMYKSKEEKREKIKRLNGVEGSGLTPPAVPVVAMASTPTVVATPVAQAAIGQAS
jgi:hypothetical protein